MNRGVRLLTLIVMLIASSASGAHARSTEGMLDATPPVRLAGGLDAEAEGAHVFVRATPGQQPFAFSLEASAATLHEVSINRTRVGHAFRDDAALLGVDEGASERRTTTSLIAPTMRSVRVEPGATFLVYPLSDASHQVDARGAHEGLIDVRPATRLTSEEGPDDATPAGEPVAYGLHYDLDHPHTDLSTTGARTTVRGDFAIHLWNIVADVASDSGTHTVFTGERTHQEAGPVTRVTLANATLVVRNATLTVLPGEDPARILGTSVTVRTAGKVAIPSATGVLEAGSHERYVARGDEATLLGDLTVRAEPRDAEATRLALTISGDVRETNLPLEVTASAARRVLEDAPWWVAGTGLVLVGFGTVLAMRTRERPWPRLRVRPHPRRPAGHAAEDAVAALQAGEYEAALEHLDVALAEDPESSNLLVDRGFCLEKLGDLQGARLAYERALLADPGRAETHYYYSRALCGLGLTTTALSHLGRALALDERLREQARDDAAFRSLRDHPQFLSQTGM